MTGVGVLGSEPIDPCGLTKDLGRSYGSAARDRDQRRRHIGYQCSDFCGELVDLLGQCAAPIEQTAGKPHNSSRQRVQVCRNLVQDGKSIQRSGLRLPGRVKFM
ncbi:hypothetical protein A5N83_02085 [Rhodococcus sp. 1139]|nr:hypothetical protein A5N83_02085 [Rhodococcus sp. 1139]